MSAQPPLPKPLPALDHMPNELFQPICRLLEREDLCNFRLVNRLHGFRGAAELFRRLVFHASWASVFRIWSIAYSPVSKEVKTLVWDTNMWTLGGRVTCLDDFKSYAAPHHRTMRKRIRDLEKTMAEELNVKPSQMHTTYRSLVDSEIHDQFVQYQRHTQEETAVLNWIVFAGDFGQTLRFFHNLRTRRVVNGRFSLSEDETIEENPTDLNSIQVLPVTSGKSLRARGEGL
jgi:hypothetical protein